MTVSASSRLDSGRSSSPRRRASRRSTEIVLVVVATMLSLPTDIESYIRHTATRGLTSLAQMFHPDVLARASRDPELRGVFAGTDAYWEQNRDSLKVTD